MTQKWSSDILPAVSLIGRCQNPTKARAKTGQRPVNADAKSSELIGLAYEAALEPARWLEFLRKTKEAVQARSILLRLIDFDNRRVALAETIGYDPAYVSAYRDHFVRLDPYAAKLNVSPHGVLRYPEEAISWHERSKSEYHNEYERPQGLRHSVGCILTKNQNYNLQFALQRGAEGAPFSEDTDSIAMLSILVPHMARAMSVHRSLSEAACQKTWALEALNKLRVGVILINERSQPYFKNHAADQLIKSWPGMGMTKEGITFHRRADAEQLARLVRDARQIARGDLATPPGCMGIASDDGNTLQIQIAPLLTEQTHWLDAIPPGSLALFLCKPGGQQLPCENLVSLYGLTRAEARLAAKLAEGLSLEEVSDEFDISIETARSQLKSIFAKTGARRQSELMAKLLTSVMAHSTNEQAGHSE